MEIEAFIDTLNPKQQQAAFDLGKKVSSTVLVVSPQKLEEMQLKANGRFFFKG